LVYFYEIHYLHSGVEGGGAGDTSAPPTVLICPKFGQNPWKSRHKWCPTLSDFKKWHPMFVEKHMKTFL